MVIKLSVIPKTVTLFAAAVLPGFAQGPQNWATNQANQIQQDATSGLINQGQAMKLETRDAQIQTQEQQYSNQNGGKLTPQENGQIRSELRNLNQRTAQDVRRDNPNTNYNNGYPQQGQPWTNRNGYNSNNGNPYNMQNAQSQNGNPSPYQHHRHRFSQQQQINPNNQQQQQQQQQYWQH